MSISDDNELRTADGEGGVELTDANMLKAFNGPPTVDKENEGAQRAGAEHRSWALGAILFGAQASNQRLQADTHSLSGDTRLASAAAVSTASPLTATYVDARAAQLFPACPP